MSEYVEQSARQFQTIDDVMSHVFEEAARVEQIDRTPLIVVSRDVLAIIQNSVPGTYDTGVYTRSFMLFGYPARVALGTTDTCIVEGLLK